MSQYFSARPDAESDRSLIPIRIENLRFSLWTDHGVFSRQGLDIGTSVLLQALYLFQQAGTLPEKADVLDLGCGYGPITIATSKWWPQYRIWAVDSNERAVSLCRENMIKEAVQGQCLLSDGLAALPEQKFDFVFTNPPIRVGKEKLRHLLEEAWQALRSEGQLILVIGKKQGAASMQRYLLDRYDSCESLYHRSGFHVFCVTKHQ